MITSLTFAFGSTPAAPAHRLGDRDLAELVRRQAREPAIE